MNNRTDLNLGKVKSMMQASYEIQLKIFERGHNAIQKGM